MEVKKQEAMRSRGGKEGRGMGAGKTGKR